MIGDLSCLTDGLPQKIHTLPSESLKPPSLMYACGHREAGRNGHLDFRRSRPSFI
jgi:hypothetical protein